MARINLVSVGIAVGVGGVDQFLEERDDSEARVGFKRWSNLARLLGSLGGYAMQIFDFYPAIGRDLAQSSTPLLTKTVWGEVKSRTGAGAASPVRRTARLSAVGRGGVGPFEI